MSANAGELPITVAETVRDWDVLGGVEELSCDVPHRQPKTKDRLTAVFWKSFQLFQSGYKSILPFLAPAQQIEIHFEER